MSTHSPLFGWIPPQDRDEQQTASHEQALLSLPEFKIVGSNFNADADKAFLWEFSKATNGGKHFKVFYQQTGSCLKGDAPVRMGDGSEKPIASVVKGDKVVTHNGQVRRVVGTFKRNFTGEMVTIKVAGFAFPLTVTADHRVAVIRGGTPWRWKPEYLEWVRADEIQEDDRLVNGWDRQLAVPMTLDTAELLGDNVVVLDELMKEGAYIKGEEPNVPVSNVCMARYLVRRSGIDWRGRVKLAGTLTKNAILRDVSVSPSLGRLIGLYLAEGGCDSGRVVFTFHAKEIAYAAEVLALVRGLFGVDGELITQTGRDTVIKVRFTNLNLESVFKALMPGNVYNKRVPGLFFKADTETKLALILGWLHGDGHATFKDKKNLSIQGCSVSSELARDMTVLALSCGIRASCHLRKARGRSRQAYIVHMSGERIRVLYPALAAEASAAGVECHSTDSRRCKFGYARRVKSIHCEKVYNLPVYDIEVEEDHSFLSNDIACHNCVGNGGGQAVWYLQAMEAVRLGERQEVKLPFWLIPYGKSREYAGMRGQGDGSLGSTFAKAIVKDGNPAFDEPGLPGYEDRGGLTWGKEQELKWSDGAAISEEWLAKARKHTVKTVAQIKSVDEAKQALINGYPMTIASNWGGLMQCPKKGSPPVLLNQRSGVWNHQMCVIGYWKHPDLGDIFCVLNSWSESAHGEPPDGAPLGSFWIQAKDMAYIIGQEEVFAFSQFEGFPAQELEKYLFDLVGKQ